MKGLERKPEVGKFPADPKKYVYIYSSVELNKVQLEVLSLGLRFCDRPKRVNHLDTDIEFENLFSQTRDLFHHPPWN
ncbi:unnamed protein product [Trichobilharzia regenti]|nr:unnamed protein product [Trichobilharzia regenti]